MVGLAILAIVGYLILKKKDDAPPSNVYVPGGGDFGGHGATGSWGDPGESPVTNAGGTEQYRPLLL